MVFTHVVISCTRATHSHIDGGEWLLFLGLLFFLRSLLLLPLEPSQLVLDPSLLLLHVLTGLLVLVGKLGADFLPSWEEGTEQKMGSANCNTHHSKGCPYRDP